MEKRQIWIPFYLFVAQRKKQKHVRRESSFYLLKYGCVPNTNPIHKFTHTTKFHDLTNNSIEPTFEKQRCNTQNRNSSVNMSSYIFVSTQVSITNFKPKQPSLMREIIFLKEILKRKLHFLLFQTKPYRWNDKSLNIKTWHKRSIIFRNPNFMHKMQLGMCMCTSLCIFCMLQQCRKDKVLIFCERTTIKLLLFMGFI